MGEEAAVVAAVGLLRQKWFEELAKVVCELVRGLEVLVPSRGCLTWGRYATPGLASVSCARAAHGQDRQEHYTAPSNP